MTPPAADVVPPAIVFVIDDNDIARTVLQRTIESAGHRTEGYESAEQFLTNLDPSRGDCVVTDVHMPGMTGVELQERLTALGSPLPVIVITGFPTTSIAIRAMQRGASTFLPKPYRIEDLLFAVDAALHKSRHAREKAARRLVLEKLFAGLQTGDHDVLDLLAAGLRNKAIAQRLDVSLRTIEARRRRIFETLGVATIGEAVRLQMEYKSLQ